MGLPEEWIAQIRARPGKMLLRRDERPTQKSGLILPPNITRSRRAALATLVCVGEGIPDLRAGQRVLLTAGYGRSIKFGPRDETTLEELGPEAVMAVIDDAEVEKHQPHPLRDLEPEELAIDEEEASRSDEGHGDAVQ